MKRLIIAAAFIIPFWLSAQTDKKNTTFGKVDKSEFESTTCSYDPDAEAEVLSEYAMDYLDINNNTESILREFQHVIRIKILKDKGKERANVKIRYYTYRNDQGISNLAANTYNLDESGNVKVTKLEKNLVYQKRINARLSEQSFTMPDVKVGSIIEYKYTVRNAMNSHWELQKSIPVRYSKYIIDVPKEFELHIAPFCSHPFESKDNSTSLRTIKSFAMAAIPGLRDEQYISSEKDYLQRIEAYPTAYNGQFRRIPLVKTWKEVVNDLYLDEQFGVQLKKDIPRTSDLDAELTTLKDDYAKMTTIHHYVRKNMEWDEVENIWANDGVKSAWKSKKGTSGEINLILVNLLKNAGLRAYPVMVSTRENGLISAGIPSYNNFNKVLAYVELDDKKYVLDGTDKYTPSGLMPENILCTEGLILDENNPNKYRWTQFRDSMHMDKNIVIINALLDEQGILSGHASVKSYDYARIKRAPFIKSGSSSFLSKFYLAKNDALKIDSLSFEDDGNDSLPLGQEFEFKTTLNQSGEYEYFTPNLFTGYRTNPFIADNRYSDVFFGTNQSFTIIGNFTIPDNYTFEELPKNVRMTLPDRSMMITRMMQASGNTVNTRVVVECKRPIYQPDEYPDLKEFYKKMFSLLEEQVVIKKKNK